MSINRIGLVSLLSIVFISGCSRLSGDVQTVRFDEFLIDIPEEYETVSTSLVENKQILNKILKSFKVTSEDQPWFDDNLIITASFIAQELDYEQFRTVNTNKLRDQVVGYEAWDKELISFDCTGSTINGIYVTFSVKDTYVQWIDTYYLSQYQFVANWTGYIISTATIDSKKQDTLRSIITTLRCPEPETETPENT